MFRLAFNRSVRRFAGATAVSVGSLSLMTGVAFAKSDLDVSEPLKVDPAEVSAAVPKLSPRDLNEVRTVEVQNPEEERRAYDPETGEIDWDCPCLGGMAHGPCGEEFKEAFACFVYSKEEIKGSECIPKFSAMQACFKKYPEVYADFQDDPEPADAELAKDAEALAQDAKHTVKDTKEVAQDLKMAAHDAKDAFVDSSSGVAESTKAAAKDAQAAAKDAESYVEDASTGVQHVAEDLGAEVKQVAENLGAEAKQLADSAKEAAGVKPTAAEKVKQEASKLSDEAKGLVSDAAESLNDKAKRAVQSVQDATKK